MPARFNSGSGTKASDYRPRHTISRAYGVAWRIPAYNTVHDILKPIYTSAYAFGRTSSKVSIDTASGAGSVARLANAMF